MQQITFADLPAELVHDILLRHIPISDDLISIALGSKQLLAPYLLGSLSFAKKHLDLHFSIHIPALQYPALQYPANAQRSTCSDRLELFTKRGNFEETNDLLYWKMPAIYRNLLSGIILANPLAKYSVEWACKLNLIDTVKTLLLDPRISATRTVPSATANANIDFLQILINSGCNHEASIILEAIKHGNVDTVRFLLGSAIGHLLLDDRHLKHACKGPGHVEVVKLLLLNRLGQTLPAPPPLSVLMYAITIDSLELVRLIENFHVEYDSLEAVLKAVQEGSLNVLRHFMNENNEGVASSCIMVAMEMGCLNVLKYCLQQLQYPLQFELITLWIHKAAENGHLDALKYLLEELEWDPNFKCGALSNCVVWPGHLHVEEYLIEYHGISQELKERREQMQQLEEEKLLKGGFKRIVYPAVEFEWTEFVDSEDETTEWDSSEDTDEEW
ncbi:UNVERIFIED_CONTAM: hypothetical protein HDU68_002157 [Siphonaria sp. JEL0065]|nr:hypothetical protein HDU68_002157 [Siphonaria sp. JEL0065]